MSLDVGLCQCGCGQSTPLARQTDKQKGWVKGQPVKFILNHHTRQRRRHRIGSTIFRDSFRVVESGCWEWTGPVNRGGYGKWSQRGQYFAAHRFSFEVHVGPIPKGLTLDHLCRNTRCVNPEHLEPVSGRENTLRGANPPARNFRKTACKRGHPFTPENTYTFGRNFRQCILCRRWHSKEYYRRHKEAPCST